jgi:hypothetical protein
MTGAITVAAVVGLLSLLAGVALGWYLRRANNWCATCGDQLSCEGCGAGANWPQHPPAVTPASSRT